MITYHVTSRYSFYIPSNLNRTLTKQFKINIGKSKSFEGISRILNGCLIHQLHYSIWMIYHIIIILLVSTGTKTPL